MKNRLQIIPTILFIILILPLLVVPPFSQELKENEKLDEKVEKFLESHKFGRGNMNVPASDGKLLYNIIIKNKYTKALEIGTSTGHSAIWIAWALSKTGGKLITIEINERRYKEAMANFKKAGLAEYIDARLADAHKLVKELKGPFDFVFSDADKYWYKQYFLDVDPKLEIDGCFTAHNIRGGGTRSRGGTGEFYNHIKSLSNYKTTLDRSGAGLSISYKKSAR